MNRGICILLALLLAGCATAPRLSTEEFATSVNRAQDDYYICLKSRTVKYLSSSEQPQDIADAVCAACERKLIAFRQTYRIGLHDSIENPSVYDYQIILTEPEKQTEILRENGRRAVVKYVLDHRTSAP
jgi:hypothetical protein